MGLLEGLKLPDILKASAAQAFALAVACAAFLYVETLGLLPPLEPWVVPLAVFFGIFGAVLWIALLVRNLFQMIDVGTRFEHWQSERELRKSVESYIPFMTEVEREIIGCLLQRKQKSFDCSVDGGHAASLLARGIIRKALMPGQHYDPERVPMIVPDAAWEVLEIYRESFPARYTKTADPWRIHWMER